MCYEYSYYHGLVSDVAQLADELRLEVTRVGREEARHVVGRQRRAW